MMVRLAETVGVVDKLGALMDRWCRFLDATEGMADTSDKLLWCVLPTTSRVATLLNGEGASTTFPH